ncbi:unnamed protein product [Brassicogethes aeneus]|uniref:Peptidase M13 N-terminal domain-containing protein n=1 Tax=Brassicogethes aeneus TaxID=1431903 RepID=A0A9P0FC96_BRAAE|nr:unnamed protein product [Brassicogethes aeneus]
MVNSYSSISYKQFCAYSAIRNLKKYALVVGGWYILRNWNDADFDKNQVLIKLHVDFGVTPFFKIAVEPNPRIPGRNAIRISPAGLGLPDKEYYYTDSDDRVQTAYKNLIRDAIIYLSTATNEAIKFGTDIFSYEKRIAEVTPSSVTLQNPIHTYNVFTLTELKDTVQLPLFDILTGLYPESNITENTEVIVTSQEYLQEISLIISSTDRKTMNGYLIWTLVKNYLPYLSTEYTSAINTFYGELLGIQHPPERWEVCTGITKKFMGLASEVLEEIENPLPEKTVKLVNETFQTILKTVKTRLDSLEIEYSALYKQLKLKLNSMSLQIGLPEKVKSEEYLKHYYLKLKIFKINFFESITNGVFFQKKLDEKKLISSPPEDIILENSSTEKMPRVIYLPAENVVIIPRILLSEPIFDPDYPKSIIYGRLGVELSNAIISAVLPYDSLWTSDRKILSPFHSTVKESLESAEKSTDCLGKYILGLNLAVPASLANETALKMLKQMTAVSVANEALLGSLEYVDHIHQPALEEFEDSALFFLSYSQTECSETTNQRQFYENIVNFGLSQKTLLHLIWSQLPEFTSAFDCSANKKSICKKVF